MAWRPRLGDIGAAEAEPQLPLESTADLGRPSAEEYLAVGLVPQASADLQRTCERTELSRADVVNRAVSLYEFADSELQAGSELMIRRATGEKYFLRLL